MGSLYRVGTSDGIIPCTSFTLPSHSTKDIALKNDTCYIVAVRIGGHWGAWFMLRGNSNLGTSIATITATSAFTVASSSNGFTISSTSNYSANVGITQISN